MPLLYPTAAAPWLRTFGLSIERAIREIWPAPLKLWRAATADLPAAADYAGGLAYNTTSLRVTWSDGTSWNELVPYNATLAALAGLDSTAGLVVQTGPNVFAKRTLAAPAAGFTITNPAGIAGNPTFVLANDLAALEGLTGTNTIPYRSGVDAWSAVTTGSALSFSGGTLDRAALTGDVTAPAGSNATTLATVNANVGSFGSATQIAIFTVNAKGLTIAAGNVTVTPAVGSITGLGAGAATALAVNVGSTGAFITFNGAAGTPSSLSLINATGLPLTSGVTGRLPFANLIQIGGLSVLGVTGSATANVAAITGTADQVLRVNGAGTALAFASIDLSKPATVGTSRLALSNVVQGAALSVLGVTSNVPTDNGAITGTADQVLRVNGAGAALAFGSIDLSKPATVGASRLALSNVAQGAALSVLGVTGNVTADNAAIAGIADQLLRVNGAGTALAFGSIDLSKSATVGTSRLALSNIVQGAAFSVRGVTGNVSANVADIAAGSDNQVLRRSGTSLAFGAVNLASTSAVTGALAVANGGTGDTGTAWTAYTPTVTAFAGAFAAVSATGYYKQIGKTVFLQIEVTITSNGTAATFWTATLPFTNSARRAIIGAKETAVLGVMGVGQIEPGSPNVAVVKYDGLYLGGNSYRINLSGTYEAA